MAIGEKMQTVIRCSYRLVGEQLKIWQEQPELITVLDLLNKMEDGKVACLTLYDATDRSMLFLGRPGLVYICLFVSDEEQYIFDDGTRDISNIDIGGDYWPSFQVCRDHRRVEEIAREFFVSGQPLANQKWIHFIEEE